MARYSFSQYLDLYGWDNIHRLYINGKRVFIGLNNEFADSVRLHNIEPKIKANNRSGGLSTECDCDIFYEADEHVKESNPILFYIFSQLSKNHIDLRLRFITGFNSAYGDIVLTDIDSIIQHYEGIL